jgi:hypothetical protein
MVAPDDDAGMATSGDSSARRPQWGGSIDFKGMADGALLLVTGSSFVGNAARVLLPATPSDC